MDIENINKKLANRRSMIRYGFITFLMSFAVLFLKIALQDNFPNGLFIVLLGICAAPFFYLDQAKCPRCQKYYTHKPSLKIGNVEHASSKGGWSRNFLEVCVNCGLHLDGSNAEEPYEEGYQPESAARSQIEQDARLISRFMGSTLFAGIFGALAYAFHFWADEEINMQNYPELGYGITAIAAVFILLWIFAVFNILKRYSAKKS